MMCLWSTAGDGGLMGLGKCGFAPKVPSALKRGSLHQKSVAEIIGNTNMFYRDWALIMAPATPADEGSR